MLSLNTFLLMFAIFGALASCSTRMLTVHSDYVTRESLASFYVDTPDPLLNCPPFGQRLVISWSVPKQLMELDDPHLRLQLRFRNREQIDRKIPLRRAKGTTVFRILNDEYCKTGGFLTYRVQLIAGECVYEESRHQLWEELIAIDRNDDESGTINFVDQPLKPYLLEHYLPLPF